MNPSIIQKCVMEGYFMCLKKYSDIIELIVITAIIILEDQLPYKKLNLIAYGYGNKDKRKLLKGCLNNDKFN